MDLGYGASAVTTLELHARLARARPDVDVVGLEIDPDRVTRARPQLEAVRAGSTGFAADARVAFALGGFEVPLPGGRRPAVIRAMNVLRQYQEAEVPAAWDRVCARLAPGGLLVEGTCDELGRITTWIALDADAVPRTLTLSLRLQGLERPSIAAERLPKALIHRNVPGERIHAFLRDLDTEWDRAAVVSPFGPVHRWQTTLDALRRGRMAVASARALAPRRGHACRGRPSRRRLTLSRLRCAERRREPSASGIPVAVRRSTTSGRRAAISP